LGTRVSFVEIGMCSGGENVHQLMLSKATLNNIKREVLCRKMERQRAFKMKKIKPRRVLESSGEDRRRRVEAFDLADAEGASRQR
jgi:hypothetical protein